jgi:WXXGXW repeat (2 copies)
VTGSKRHILVGAVVAALLLAGCVATVEERPPRVVYVGGPPPPPLVDAQGAPAAPGMVWVEGYWHWNGVQYVWIPGHWESPPAGYVWVGPSYTIVGGRHLYRAGRWSQSTALVAPR